MGGYRVFLREISRWIGGGVLGLTTLYPLPFDISQVVKTKSTKDVIEFYYVWKMTSHYQQWKRGFEPLEPHPFHIAAPDA